MSFVYKKYTLNSYLESTWYSTEIALFEAILDKLPDFDKTYVSTQHYHNRVAQPTSGAAVLTADDLGKLNLVGYTGGFLYVGDLGVVSSTGIAGGIGQTGAEGVAGATGLPGSAGSQGATGLAGSAAAMGATGLQGAAGAVGATGIQGLQGVTGTAGFTGLTDNYLPRKASDGKLINSNLSEVPLDLSYAGESIKITRTDNGSYPPYLILKHSRTTPGIDDSVGRIQLIGKNSVAADQVYCQIDAQIDDKTSGSELSHVNINTAAGGATVVKARIGSANGVQAYNSPFYNVDTALSWTEDQSVAFGCETGVQNTDGMAREGGACSKIDNRNTSGGLLLQGFTKENTGVAVEINARNEGESGGQGCVKIVASQRNGTGLTGIEDLGALVAVYNHTTKVFGINGNGKLIANSINSSETVEGVTGLFSGGITTPKMVGCTGIQIHGKTLDYDTGTFFVSLTGCTGSFGVGVTGTAHYTRVGNAVSLRIPQVAGFANVNTATIEGLPTALQTAAHSDGNPELSMQCYQLSAGIKQGTIVIANATTMTLHSNNIQGADAWETTGGRTIYAQYQTYLLD